MTTLVIISFALLLDLFLKEPRRFHPLAGFGRWAKFVEKTLDQTSIPRMAGCLAWLVTVVPITVFFYSLDSYFSESPIASIIFSSLVLYLSIGWQSLMIHADHIKNPLERGKIAEARIAVSRIISRDTNDMSEADISRAASESVLENGSDAIFAALFWFVILGAPGAVLYRLSNTLDAMWGYKNARYLYFGWAAARIDDLLNCIPARLTALSYALAGNRKKSLEAWQAQASSWKSPNAGPVMAAGAGAINTKLGGGAKYHGEWQCRPLLGPEDGVEPSAETIGKACTLVNKALLVWLAIIALGGACVL